MKTRIYAAPAVKGLKGVHLSVAAWSDKHSLQVEGLLYIPLILPSHILTYVVNISKYQLKVNYHPLYSMNNFVTDTSKLPQDGAQVFPYMGWLAIMWPSERVT